MHSKGVVFNMVLVPHILVECASQSTMHFYKVQVLLATPWNVSSVQKQCHEYKNMFMWKVFKFVHIWHHQVCKASPMWPTITVGTWCFYVKPLKQHLIPWKWAWTWWVWWIRNEHKSKEWFPLIYEWVLGAHMQPFISNSSEQNDRAFMFS